MNDLNVYIGAGVACVAVIIMLLTLRSGNDSLANAKVGQVYNFEYEQPYHGDRKRVLAKVVEPVYTLNDYTIKRLNRTSNYRRNDPLFQRTNHLVVCETADGEVRQFYAERAKNVRRSLLGGFLLKSGVASLLF